MTATIQRDMTGNYWLLLCFTETQRNWWQLCVCVCVCVCVCDGAFRCNEKAHLSFVVLVQQQKHSSSCRVWRLIWFKVVFFHISLTPFCASSLHIRDIKSNKFEIIWISFSSWNVFPLKQIHRCRLCLQYLREHRTWIPTILQSTSSLYGPVAPSSFAAVIIPAATRGRCLARNLNMCDNKLLSCSASPPKRAGCFMLKLSGHECTRNCCVRRENNNRCSTKSFQNLL